MVDTESASKIVFYENGTMKNVICLSVEDIPCFYVPDHHFMFHFFTIQPDTAGKFIGINCTGSAQKLPYIYQKEDIS
jgi:hypothetical protein